MVDREKVLAGLESCADRTGALCRTCPYDFVHNENCMGDMARDALELMNEQPKKAHWVKMTGMMPPEFTGHFECDNCGWHGKLGERETDYDFCPGCGARMKVGFPGFDGDDCKSTPFDEILGDYLKKMDNENEKEK